MSKLYIRLNIRFFLKPFFDIVGSALCYTTLIGHYNEPRVDIAVY
ncbi:hypothetical protein DSUL_20023 [Desulfovibrionales bacterium]